MAPALNKTTDTLASALETNKLIIVITEKNIPKINPNKAYKIPKIFPKEKISIFFTFFIFFH